MAILCEKARILFLPGIGEESTALKRVIHLIETGREAGDDIDNQPVFETVPLPRFWSPPPGYETLGFIKDPIHRLFDIWRFLANPAAFERTGSLAALEAKGLDPDPDFAGFVTRLGAYRRLSPEIGTACLPVRRFLGPAASRLDHAFAPGDYPAARSLLFRRAGLQEPPENWTPRRHAPILEAPVLGALRRRTRADFRWTSAGGFDASPFLASAICPDAVDPRSLPAVTAPEAPPDPDLDLVALVREPPELIRAFVTHYKRIGTGHLHLHFDDPTDPMADELAPDPRVSVTRCDADFWSGPPPASIEVRQKACFSRIYAGLARGWLICCDADELIYPGTSLPELLRHVPADQHFIRANAGEAVWTETAPTDALFSATHIRQRLRPPHWPSVRARIHGDAWPLLYQNMAAHLSGKYLLRAGQAVREINIHNVVFEHADNRTFGRDADGIEVSLVHHDAPSYDLWHRKLSRRLEAGHGFYAQGSHRDRQVAAFAEAREKGGEPALFRSLYCLSDDARRLLGACDVLRRIG